MFLSTISSTYRIEKIIIINNTKYIIVKHKLSLVIYIIYYQIHILC